MPRYERNGEIYEAIRYQPTRPGHIIHRLSELGIPCIHVRSSAETIEIASSGTSIAIRDSYRNLNGVEGTIYPGDWIVWRNLLEIEIVPSRVFAAQYIPLSG